MTWDATEADHGEAKVTNAAEITDKDWKAPWERVPTPGNESPSKDGVIGTSDAVGSAAASGRREGGVGVRWGGTENLINIFSIILKIRWR